MRFDFGKLAGMAGSSLFVGIIIVSIGFGALIPLVYRWTAPLICRGEVKGESIKYSYKPGQVGWENHVYCVDEAGVEKEITFPAIGMFGLVASAVIFLVWVMLSGRGLLAGESEAGTRAAPEPARKPVKGKKQEESALDRLTELKKMRDSNLISDVEYERKKAEIMEAL